MKKVNFFFAFALLALFSFSACNTSISEPGQPGAMTTPKNIILLIGDGMGLTQVSTAFYYQEETSNFTRFKHIGLHKNMPTSHKVTDSAAGATAFSAGVKTYNGAIGVNQDTFAVPTILEMVAEKGWSTGVVATSSIVHATPASFYAHTAFRSSYEEIARQLCYSPVNFFAGGGIKFFAARSDKLNFIDTLMANNFEVEVQSLKSKKFDINKKYGYLLSADGMPKMQDGRGDFLPKATKMALNHLSQDEDGFFLMVEGSQIDWGGHANDADYVIQETLDFDKTLGEVLDFAKKDKNTLVIVTADHETGGLSLSAATVYGQSDYGIIAPSFSTGNHSATLIPVFAYGPGAENFMGIYENNEIFDKMLKAIKMKKPVRNVYGN
jgi:alkaline phosphatase